MKQNKLILVLIIIILVFSCFACSIIDEKLYPLEYKDTIKKYATEYNLDPYLVMAVIHTESGFDAQAESKAGAMGLMQVMPTTGEWIAGKPEIAMEDFTAEDLLNPDTNIKFGCWYLNFLSDRFDNQTNMLAAYNAGHTRVGEWLENEEYAKDGELVNIPYEETDNYVEKVQKAYDKYKELYKEI